MTVYSTLDSEQIADLPAICESRSVVEVEL